MASKFTFNQMGAKAGVKMYGDRAIDAIVSEGRQLDDERAFKPRAAVEQHLTELERKRALRSITPLGKEKKMWTV